MVGCIFVHIVNWNGNEKMRAEQPTEDVIVVGKGRKVTCCAISHVQMLNYSLFAVPGNAGLLSIFTLLFLMLSLRSSLLSLHSIFLLGRIIILF